MPDRASRPRRTRSDPERSRLDRVAWWRLPIEPRALAWMVLGLILIAMVAVIAVGVSISVGRHRCAEACAEYQYAFMEYKAASRFGTKPAVCTCSKDGASVEVPLR